jgi:hypothetical protein
MQIEDAQRDVRTVFLGGFFGQLISAVIWLTAAALATWVSPKASIITAVAGGFFIYPLTLLAIQASGRATSLAPGNPLGQLGMQVAIGGAIPMLLLLPVAQLRLSLFFPALMIIIGAHYLPFIFLYGMRVFLPLCAALTGAGILLALYAPNSFSLGAWVGGAILFVFAWILRFSVPA